MNTPHPPITVYGATGFTGKLVAEHLLARGADIAIAGRNPEKLAKVAADLGAPDLPIVVADAADRASLDAMVAATDVVVSTVGPFFRLGREVVAACAATGTDYVDSTGEPHFVRLMMDEHGAAAAASGARLLHCCGYDSVPSDLGVLVAQETMHERHGVYSPHVRSRVKYAKGGASGGTLRSMVEMVQAWQEDPAIGEVMDDANALMPEGERVGPDHPLHFRPFLDEDHDRWAVRFFMELINGRIVRRSNALLDYPWGREFRYDEGILLGRGAKGRATATALGAALGTAMGPGASTLQLDAVRQLLDRVLPDAGTGPDEAARMAGGFEHRLTAAHPDDHTKDVHVTVSADRDPGYGATAQMLGETALGMAHGLSEVDGGSWTTAAALGAALVEQLEAHSGLRFEVDGW